MTEPTPRSAAPADVRRLELVGELMASLDGVEELPLDQLANRLGEAQGVLAGVLNNDPSVTQLGIPGVAR
ncbi:MAG TPA: hypothetical protein PKG51_07405 [Arachnia sp.]|nr:hypothetical protein [Arachnia sp.]